MSLEQRRKFFKKHKYLKRLVIIILFPICVPISIFVEVVRGNKLLKEIKEHIDVTKEMW